MYVCICNAVTDKQIREAAKDGVTDLWGLERELGVASGCGSCRETASEILSEHRNDDSYEFAQPVVYTPSLA